MFDFEEKSKVKITPKLKSRFCKDMNLSIKIFDEPYFENLIRLFDNQYGTIEAYADFVKTVEKFGSEDAYYVAYDKLKDDAINYLKSQPSMVYFSEKEDMNQFACKNVGYSQGDIYKACNDGCVFVSIDMKKANFTAVHNYNPEIVGGKDTYEDFIGMFTDVQHFIKSKYIRQVIFGNINPKRQVTYEKYLMDKVLTKLFEMGNISKEDVYSFATDEIVIKVPAEKYSTDVYSVKSSFVFAIQDVVNWANENNIFIRADFFVLRAIPGCKGFVKKFICDKSGIDFKCLDFLTMPFVLRAYNGEKPNELDRVFLYEGRLVKLLEDIVITAV